MPLRNTKCVQNYIKRYHKEFVNGNSVVDVSKFLNGPTLKVYNFTWEILLGADAIASLLLRERQCERVRHCLCVVSAVEGFSAAEFVTVGDNMSLQLRMCYSCVTAAESVLILLRICHCCNS